MASNNRNRNLIITIMVDDSYWYTSANFSDTLGHLMSIILPDLKYMSADGIKNAILESLSMVEDAMEEEDANVNRKDRSKTRRKITIMRNYLKKDVSINVLIPIVVNTLLGSEGLGTLHGFSTPTGINPELMPL